MPLITTDVELVLDLLKNCIHSDGAGANFNIRNTKALCTSSNSSIRREI